MSFEYIDDTFVHTGSDHFDPELMMPVCNTEHTLMVNKPGGGLYACRDEAEYSWKRWCTENSYDHAINKEFKFKLRPDAKVLSIFTPDDIKNIDDKYILGSKQKTIEDIFVGFSEDFKQSEEYEDFKNFYAGLIGSLGRTILNYEKLAEDYDAIYVGFGKDYAVWEMFYGWDCDTLLVFNPDVIIPEQETQ